MTKKITLESISRQIEQGFASVEARLEKNFAAVADDIATMVTKDDILNMATKNDIAHLEKGQQQTLEKLEPLSRAHDKDSVTLVDHGRRITRIEKQLAA